MNINSNKIVLICYLWLLMLVVADAGSGLKAQDVQHTVDVVNDYFSVERALTTENGLPANGVNGVIQDSKGYIWATTFGGLIRYDGKRIVTYNTSNLPGLESNRFLDISEDKDGRIWAGLEYNNLVMVDGDSVAVYKIDADLIGFNSHVIKVVPAPDGSIWLATSGGYVIFNDGEFTRPEDSIPDVVFGITHAENHSYVVYRNELHRVSSDGTLEEVLVEMTGDVFDVYGKYQITEFSNVVQMIDVISRDDSILLLHEAGIVKLLDDHYEILLYRDDIGNGAFHGFFEQDEIFYIFGSVGLVTTEQLEQPVKTFKRVSTLSLQDVLVDNENSLWTATSANGLRQFVSTPIYQGDDYNMLNDTPVTAILEDQESTLWIATNCGWLYAFQDNEYQLYTNDDGIMNACIWSLMEQNDGTLWTGTWGGGVYYKPKDDTRFERFNPAIMEDADAVLSIFEDSSGNIWFGTYFNGVFKYDGNETVSIKNEDGGIISSVRMFYETEDGNIIVASDRGIGFVNGNQISKPVELMQLESQNFRTIAKDSEGRFWFGSYGGGMIVYTPDGEVEAITTQNGLVDNTVSQLVFDKDENLWLAGNMGVSFIEKSQLELFLRGEIDLMRVARMGVMEGMTTRETTGGFMPSSHYTDTGELYIPTVQGLTKIYTDQMELNRSEPNVYIEEIEIDGQVYNSDQISEISHDAQRIIFRFTALSFKNPDYVKFEYKMEGIDSEWRSVSEARETVYTSIPPGDYTLLVRASNNDGFWNLDGATLAFTVKPPFWQTAWFYLLMIVFVVAVLFAGYRKRVRNIKKQNRQLEQMVEERTAELKVTNQQLNEHIEYKDKLHSVLAHDLRNPFTSIIGYLEYMKSDLRDSGHTEHVEMINMLLDAGRNTLNLMENLLQWSGSKSWGLELRLQEIDISQLVKEAIKMTEAQAAFKNVEVNYLSDGDYMVMADRNMILSVIRNLTSNAIKYSGNGSEVSIKVNDENGKVTVSVIDSGVGIKGEDITEIFSSNENKQKLGTSGEKGMGIGLMLCKEFVEKHDGEIWAESKPGEGSIFSFSLKKHFIPQSVQPE